MRICPRKGERMLIREVIPEEIPAAMLLAREVFLVCEAPDYTSEGVAEFFRTIEDSDFIQKLRIYGAWDEGDLVGVLATRPNGTHIALFFVRAQRQDRCIGRMLFNQVVKDAQEGPMTVNSSPYAVVVYKRLGFEETSWEQLENGIRFAPMQFPGVTK